jgi:hypothetical protein
VDEERLLKLFTFSLAGIAPWELEDIIVPMKQPSRMRDVIFLVD